MRVYCSQFQMHRSCSNDSISFLRLQGKSLQIATNNTGEHINPSKKAAVVKRIHYDCETEISDYVFPLQIVKPNIKL